MRAKCPVHVAFLDVTTVTVLGGLVNYEGHLMLDLLQAVVFY